MKIRLLNAGKRYNREWIFRGFSFEFDTPGRYAVTGPNGSGKSTLLQLLSGAISNNEGTVEWLNADHGLIAREQIHRQIALCAPYLELIEEFSLTELLTFHQQFKPLLPGFSIKEIIEIVQLDQAGDKKIADYSSGMKQRAKLAQCIFSATPLVLLDEPCSNLDDAGIRLYQELLRRYCLDRLVVISSNDAQEYEGSDRIIAITDYKKTV
ncbi:heme ABC exporter ATP-binding protein CcmA [Niabella terrae]